MSEHKKKKTPTEKVSGLLTYNPYTVFDSRKGCIAAIAISTGFIVVLGINAVLSSIWLSLIFVPMYGWIIANRLKKLRDMHE